MIKPDIYINLTEKDVLINEWLSCVKEQDRNATAICLEAIAYYANTGRILKLGGVTGKQKAEKKRLHLYAPVRTEAYQYLSGQAEKGKKVASIIRSILLAGIELSEYCWVISEKDILLQKSGQFVAADKENGHGVPKIPERIEETSPVPTGGNVNKQEEDKDKADDIFSILNVPNFGK